MRCIKTLVAVFACLSATVAAFDLQCEKIGDTNWNVVGNLYTCFVSNLVVTQKGEPMESANSVESVEQLKALDILSQNLLFMPKFTDSLAQRLEALSINNCHLTSVDQNDLRQFPNLRSLWIARNDIESLGSGLFLSTPKLEVISFTNNRLTFVAPNVLLPLTALRLANFENAGCVSYRAETSEQLEVLKFQLQTQCQPAEQNLIEKLEQQIAALEKEKIELTNELNRLEGNLKICEVRVVEEQRKVSECGSDNIELDQNLKSCNESLNACSTKCVDSNAFGCAVGTEKNVCQAENLQVENAKVKIQSVKLSAGQSLNGITELVIDNQILKFFPLQLAKKFSKLQKLRVMSSDLTLLAKTDFDGFVNLKSLEIWYNNLTSIHAETFNAVPQLENLDLTSNSIQSLPAKVFESLIQLQVLRLSKNNLKILNANILPTSNAIKQFIAGNNQIEKIDPKLLVILQNADIISLDGNVCTDVSYYKSQDTCENELMKFSLVVLNCSSF